MVKIFISYKRQDKDKVLPIVEEINCCVSRRYAYGHSKKTSGLGLRLIIRKNIER